jgi:hypothetical protein
MEEVIKVDNVAINICDILRRLDSEYTVFCGFIQEHFATTVFLTHLVQIDSEVFVTE